MDQIDFINMQDGTAEEYAFLEEQATAYNQAHLVDHILGQLKMMAGPKLGYKIDRYQHSLQSATRALRDGAEEEMVVAALLHDIGDVVAPDNHSEYAAAVLRPYVSEKTYWIVKHHGIFQGYYFWHHLGGDRNARERHRDHPWFDDCAQFCADYDQNCFDPDYENEPLETFEPMVRRIFARKPWSQNAGSPLTS